MASLIVLGGFLGSGKTSLLTHLAKHLAQTTPDKKTSLAIIENEIGEVGVDDKILGTSDYAMETIFSGCACCTLSGPLLEGIQRIDTELEPNYIILEATGMAVPNVIKQMVEAVFDMPVRACCVVDAKRWRKFTNCMIEDVIKSQLEGADVILINKIDMVPEEDLRFVEQSVRDYNASALIAFVNATSDVDVALLDEIAGRG